MYIFGGQKNSTENTDQFYEFNFETGKFTLITSSLTTNPPPLDSHCANLWKKNSNTESMIISCGFIGGNIGAHTSSVWEFNFTDSTWLQLFTHKETSDEKYPNGRMGAASAIIGNHLFLFGGTDNDIRFRDFWDFDLSSKLWKKIPQSDNTPEVVFFS